MKEPNTHDNITLFELPDIDFKDFPSFDDVDLPDINFDIEGLDLNFDALDLDFDLTTLDLPSFDDVTFPEVSFDFPNVTFDFTDDKEVKGV